MSLKWRILAAALAGLLAMYLLYQREDKLEKQAFGGDRIQVLIAKSGIRAGARIKEQDLETMLVPEVYLHPQAIRGADSGTILGRPVVNEIKQGQPLQWTDFGSSENGRTGGIVPKGLRGTAIAVNEFIGKSGLASAGDRVDVLGTFGQSGEMKGSVTMTLLQNIPLIEISGTTAVLALELEDAELLTFASTHGSVSLLLRNAEDLDTKKDIPPKNFKNLVSQVRDLESILSDRNAAPVPGRDATAKRPRPR